MPKALGQVMPSRSLSRSHNPTEIFVGRESEIEQLRAQAHRAATGVTQLAVVEGQSGIGKSRLLQEAFSDLSGFRQLYVRLDEHDQARIGATAWRVFHNGEEPIDAIDAPLAEQIAAAIEIVDSIEKPMIVVVEDLHWIDDVSAEVLWRVTRAVDKFPGLLVATIRPSERQHLRRLVHSAQTNPEASHIPLEPLSMREARIFLEARVGLPLSRSTVELVYRETDGFPLHLDAVGRWLAQAPEDQRTVTKALARLRDSADSRVAVFERAIAASLAAIDPDIGEALLGLAVSSQPLPGSALTAYLGRAFDHDALLATAMVRWYPQERSYEIEHKNVAQAIKRAADPDKLADWHLRLIDRNNFAGTLRHLVSAREVQPERVDLDALIADLQSHGEQAVERGGARAVLDLLLAASRLAPSPETATLLVRGILQAEAFAELAEAGSVLGELPDGILKSAAIALIELNRNDVLAAYRELSSVVPAEGDDPEAVLIFADAVSRVGRQGAAAGFFAQGEVLFATALKALDGTRILSEGEDPAVVARRRAAVESHRGVISFWQLLQHGDPSRVTDLPAQLRKILERLEQTPGTRIAQSTIRGLLGERLRQLGNRAEAATELVISLTQQDNEAAFDVYAQAQLALILFEAALWDDAYAASEQALAFTVEYGEDVGAFAAYAVSALILGARGEEDAAQVYVWRLENAPEGTQSPVVRALLDYARAWTGLCAGEDEVAAAAMLRIADNPVGWVLLGITSAVILGRSLSVLGRTETLPELLRSVEDPRIPADPRVRAYVAAHLGALSARARSTPAEAMAFFREALEHIDALPPLRPTVGDGNGLRLFRALLVLDMADLVIAHRSALEGERDGALILVSWAASTFRRCGAGALAQRAADQADELRSWTSAAASLRVIPRARDPRPRPAEQFAFDALNRLTSRERQIALLVGEGQANREIAMELVISVRTVEYHVANVLSKLEVGSRVDLRRLLRKTIAGAPWRRA